MSRVISGEPLPVPPEVPDKETGAFYRKLIDYLRRLSAKLQAEINSGGNGSIEVYSAWIENNATLDATFGSIDWTKDLRVDAPYSHSESVNPEKITINLDGFYVIFVDLDINTGETAPIETQIKFTYGISTFLAKFGSGLINDFGTLSQMIPVPLKATTVIEVQAQDAAAGTTTLLSKGSRITIMRLRADSGGGPNGGSGWATGWQLTEV